MVKLLSNLRLKMLNKEAASLKNKPDEIIKNLDIQNGEIIGDIGAGGGYFSFKFSKRVGYQGRVYAIDASQKALTFIGDKSKKDMLDNIKPVLAYNNGFMLPETVDIFFLRNVFHHLPNPVEYLKNIKKFLKKDGKLVIIDHQKNGFSFMGIFDHFIPEELIIKTVEKSGFYLSEKFDFLTGHSFTVYKMK